jgi:RNA polymerase sigma-70 factor (ECF subfamily)
MDAVTVGNASRSGDSLVALLQAVSQGDHRAFANLYERTSAKLYGICLRLLGGEAEAQEVLQEAYVTVWRNANRFDPTKASPITWLAVLARNKAIDRLRRSEITVEPLNAAAEVQDESRSAFDVAVDAQNQIRLNHCLDELEDRTRAMIKAAFLDGASYPQLAEREGVPLPTMKSWIRRGLQRLRGCLDHD